MYTEVLPLNLDVKVLSAQRHQNSAMLRSVSFLIKAQPTLCKLWCSIQCVNQQNLQFIFHVWPSWIGTGFFVLKKGKIRRTLFSCSKDPVKYLNLWSSRVQTVCLAYFTSLWEDGKQTHVRTMQPEKLTDVDNVTASYKILHPPPLPPLWYSMPFTSDISQARRFAPTTVRTCESEVYEVFWYVTPRGLKEGHWRFIVRVASAMLRGVIWKWVWRRSIALMIQDASHSETSTNFSRTARDGRQQVTNP